LVTGKYRYKIAYNKHELNRKTKKLHIDVLREPSAVSKFQQLEKELGKPETEQAAKGEIRIEEEWKQLRLKDYVILFGGFVWPKEQHVF
jgi:hypothetical protein